MWYAVKHSQENYVWIWIYENTNIKRQMFDPFPARLARQKFSKCDICWNNFRGNNSWTYTWKCFAVQPRCNVDTNCHKFNSWRINVSNKLHMRYLPMLISHSLIVITFSLMQFVVWVSWTFLNLELFASSGSIYC